MRPVCSASKGHFIKDSKETTKIKKDFETRLRDAGISRKDQVILKEVDSIVSSMLSSDQQKKAAIKAPATPAGPGKKILMISTYPPTKCGIGTYASQSVDALRKEGCTVTTISPDERGDVDYRLNLKGRLKPLQLIKMARSYDKVIIQYHHDFYCDFSEKRLQGVLMPNLALTLVFLLSRNVEIVCHEFFAPPSQTLKHKLVFMSEKTKWRVAPRIIFHTEKERENFCSTFKKDFKRVFLKEHHQDFQVYRRVSKEEARKELGLPQDQKVFLCIGFIQPNKGFDRVARIFRKIRPAKAHLYIVGSTRVSDDEYLYYLNYLSNLVEGCDCISLVNQFVSNEEFDTWTCAADYMVCPYREIWSSGIVARAKLFDKKVIATSAGGLTDQLAPDDLLFEADFELAQIMQTISSEEQAQKDKLEEHSVRSLVSRKKEQKQYKLAFVIPWYGPDISGGAEFLCRRHAEELAKAGQQVEVLTTCMQQFESDWSNNFHPEGSSIINGVKVHRFKVEKRDEQAFENTKAKLMSGETLTAEEEKTFVSEMIRCPGLLDFISSKRNSYDFFLFMPYMFSTTYFGMKCAAEKAVIIPCLHDEPYAQLEIYRKMLQGAGKVLFNSEPERQLAQELYRISDKASFVTGVGIDDTRIGYKERFQKKFGINNFILYIGRRIEDKNYPLLLDFFRRYKRHNPSRQDLKLVALGSGNITSSWSDDVVELGFVQPQDKHDAYAAAKVLVQPSVNESFSIVMMEAWLAETPALVNANCPATKYHCVSSNGGLYFKNYEEFNECLDFFQDNQEVRDKMGENGYFYVAANYNWKTVIRKYLTALEE